jgi:hypothetical protein
MTTDQILTVISVVQSASISDILNAVDLANEQGAWTPANLGSEEPFMTRSGRTLLYCFQMTTGKHAYLDCGTDLILSDEEAVLAMGRY